MFQERIKLFIKFIFLLSLMIYSISFCFWGRGNNDVYFWINIYRSSEPDIMIWGTYLAAKIWCNTFGYTLLSVRILNWICNIIAFSIPVIALYRMVFFRKSILVWYGIALVFMGYGTFNEFSPYSLTFLILSFIVTVMLAMQQSVRTSIFYGICCGFATVVRFPNVLSFVIVCSFIIINGFYNGSSRKKVLLNCFLMIAFFVVTSVTIYSIGNYNMISLYSSISSVDNNHSWVNLLDGLFERSLQMFEYCAIVVLFYILSTIDFKDKVVYVFIKCFIFFMMFLFLRFGLKIHFWANLNLHFMLCALTLVICCKFLISSHNENQTHLVFAILLMFIPAMGSDVSLLKLFPNVLIFIPVVMPYMVSNKYLTLNYTSAILLFVLTAFTVFCYTQNNISKKVDNSCNTLLCMSGFHKNNTMLHGILLSDEDLDFIDTLQSDVNELSDQFICYGNWSHYAYAVVGRAPSCNNSFFMWKNDSIQLTRIFDCIQNCNDMALFDFEDCDSHFFKGMLKQYGLEEAIKRNYYTVYSRRK